MQINLYRYFMIIFSCVKFKIHYSYVKYSVKSKRVKFTILSATLTRYLFFFDLKKFIFVKISIMSLCCQAKPYYGEKLKESKVESSVEHGKILPACLSSFHSNWERVKIKEQEEKEQRTTWYFASSTFQHGVAQCSSLHSPVPSFEFALLLPILSLLHSLKSFLVAQK